VDDLLPPSFWAAAHRVTTGGAWPPASPGEARRLVEACARHGLLPLLLEDTGLPPSLAQALEDARGWRRILEMRARTFHDATVEVCDLLAGEPPVLLKGADFAHRLYPSPFLRPMQDVDLLVPADRIDATCEHLVAAGLVPVATEGAVRDPGYHERALAWRKLLVEVHQSFIQRPRHRIDYAGIWIRRVPMEVGGRRAFRLDDVDALLYQALTIAKDEFQVRLVRYVDLWLLLGRREGIATAAAERAREWEVARAYYGALCMACRLFPGFRTDDVRTAMDRTLPATTRRFVERLVVPRPTAHRPGGSSARVVRLWRKALLMDSALRRVSFALWYAAATLRARRPG
jgi:hypothetical protein